MALALVLWISRFFSLEYVLKKQKKSFLICFADYKGPKSEPFISAKLSHILNFNTFTFSIFSSFHNTKIKPLKRRFPIEAHVWRRMVNAAPETYQNLLRGLAVDVLIWMKTDQNMKRLRLVAFFKNAKEKTACPYDFAPSVIEPIPIGDLHHYEQVIRLFVLAQVPVPYGNPNTENRDTFLAYSKRIQQLSRDLDNVMSSRGAALPKSFKFRLLQLQAWAWFICGAAVGDKVKLGRAIRAYEEVLKNWPPYLSAFEKGQTLSNLSALKMNYANRISGLEGFEQTLETITEAQHIFSRIKHPKLWAKLQYIRANAQLQLGRRQADDTLLEAAVHSLRTTLRLWEGPQDQAYTALAQKQISDILRHLGNYGLGTERLEQSIVAYRSAIQILQHLPPLQEHLLHARLGYAKTLMELARRNLTADQYIEASDELEKAYKFLKQRPLSSHNLADCRLLLGQAHLEYALLAQQNSQNAPYSHQNLENFVHRAQKHLKGTLKTWPKDVIIDKIINLDQLAQSYISFPDVHMGLKTYFASNQTIANISQAREHLTQALELFDSIPEHINGHILSTPRPYQLTGKLAYTLRLLGEAQKSDTHLKAACDTYENALELVVKENNPKDQTLLHYELAQTLLIRMQHYGMTDTSVIYKSINNFQNALNLTHRKNNPLLWADIRAALGDALTFSGAFGGGTPALELAAESFRKALEVWSEHSFIDKKAKTLTKIAHILVDISRRETNGNFKNYALSALNEAYDLFQASHNINAAASVLKQIQTLKDTQSSTIKTHPSVIYYPKVAE